MNYTKREGRAGYLFALPSISGFLFFFLIPFGISIFYCFTRGVGRIEYVGFDNFKNLLSNNAFLMAVKNTIIFNLVAVPLVMVVSLGVSLILNSKIKGGSFFRTILTLPIIIPVASVSLLWQLIFARQGFLNQLLRNITNIIGPDYINTNWSFIILVMLYVWKNCGYCMIIFLAGLNNIPKEYYEAASMDGCSRVRSFFKITLPLLSSTIFFGFIIAVINSLRVYREAYLIFGQYPSSNIYMLQHFMNNNFSNLNYQILSTASVLVFIFVTMVLGLLFKLQKKYEV